MQNFYPIPSPHVLRDQRRRSNTSNVPSCLVIVIGILIALSCIYAVGVNGPLSHVSLGEGSQFWQNKVKGTIFEWAGNFALVWLFLIACACYVR